MHRSNFLNPSVFFGRTVYILKDNIATCSPHFLLVKEKVADAFQYHIRRARQNYVNLKKK